MFFYFLRSSSFESVSTHESFPTGNCHFRTIVHQFRRCDSFLFILRNFINESWFQRDFFMFFHFGLHFIEFGRFVFFVLCWFEVGLIIRRVVFRLFWWVIHNLSVIINTSNATFQINASEIKQQSFAKVKSHDKLLRKSNVSNGQRMTHQIFDIAFDNIDCPFKLIAVHPKFCFLY